MPPLSGRTVKLRINGENQDVPEGITILGLLEFLKIKGERVAVEVNTEVVRRAQHAEHALREGDEVEIVTFVGGG